MSKQRKGELTAASVIFMLLVIFIHAAAEGVSGYRVDSLQFLVLQSMHRLSSFVVQGFLFLSGLKLFLPSKKPFSYRKFYLSRLKRVGLPYLFVFTLIYVYSILTNRITPSVPHFLTELFTGGLTGHFYFVAVICQFYLLIPLWRWVSRRSPFLWIPASLLLMTVLKTAVPEVLAQFGIEFSLNSRMFWYYLFYFVAGIFAGRYYDAFVRMLKQHTGEIAVWFVLTGIVDCANLIVIRRGLYYPSWSENFHTLYCAAAVLFTLCMSLKLAHLSEKPWMKLTDGASYNVYLIHPLFIFIADSLMNRAGLVSLTLRLGVRFVLVYAFSIGICVLWEFAKKRPKTPPAVDKKRI
ncbi:MAG: acyltransferase [Clostridia bacterium]|nr:acyltransferase [Clostridia bacterium]